jgi:hypothetical protein
MLFAPKTLANPVTLKNNTSNRAVNPLYAFGMFLLVFIAFVLQD